MEQAIEIEKHTSSLEVINQNNTDTINSHLETLERCVVDRISIIIAYRKMEIIYQMIDKLILIESFIGKINGI